ncbi:uncharacterized protein LOC110248986, partial [Paramuricea clavata]
ESSPPERWKHVKGNENPADAGSHGILPKDIINHDLWWSGQHWLKSDPSTWESKLVIPRPLEAVLTSGIREEDLKLKDKREVSMPVNTTNILPRPVIDINRYSSFIRLMRVTAFIRRVVTKKYLFTSTPLTVDELHKAETWWFKKVQSEMFSEVIAVLKKGKQLSNKHYQKSLNPFHDSEEAETQATIANFCSTQGIQWKLSPPTGPHHGSVWENSVKACKYHLKRIVGETKLNFEELTTCLCQIEACLNSRLIAASIDSNDDDGIALLTPGHFLIGRPLESLPDHPDTVNKPMKVLKRWYLCQALVQQFLEKMVYRIFELFATFQQVEP